MKCVSSHSRSAQKQTNVENAYQNKYILQKTRGRLHDRYLVVVVAVVVVVVVVVVVDKQ